jgi:CheY-like chemotaxis protein/HPt (histidine-containing phosphotransfer) domain-containing protein
MNIRERLYGIADLNISKRLVMMTDSQLETYLQNLHSFVESYPAEEDALRRITEEGDPDSIVKQLSLMRETLKNIYADRLADDCWQHITELGKTNIRRVKAYVNFFLSSLTELSIDIQMVFYKDSENQVSDEAAVAEDSPQATAENPVKTILAVDDDTYCLDVFKAALKDTDFRVIAITSCYNAFNVLKVQTPDLFVLDIEMPEMNGIDFALEIKKMGYTAPIIFITGNAVASYVIKAMSAGGSDFIVKPINPRNVVKRINKLLA